MDFSGRWHAIKTAFSKQIPEGEFRSASRLGKGERGIWQRRFWDHTIRVDQDYGAHFDYIHFNPVRHGLVAIPPIGLIIRFIDRLRWGYIRLTG